MIKVTPDNLINILEENGILVVNNDLADEDLRENFDDSIHFMSTVLSIEERFGITFPAEVMDTELFSSLSGLYALLVQLQAALVFENEGQEKEAIV